MKFFVCYSRSIETKVQEVVAMLRDEKEVEIWWDQDIRAGQDWWATIIDHIETCEIFIFLLSEKAVQSPYCVDELRYALTRNRPVLPFVMDGPVAYPIPSEIMQSRIQYELYSGNPSHLKQRIMNTCKELDWTQYKDRYAVRPPEPNTGSNSLVDRLEKAVTLAQEGIFDEAIRGFNDVRRSDFSGYGVFCDTWIEKINRYRDVVNHAHVPALLSLAEHRWDNFLKQFSGGEIFDPLGMREQFAQLLENPIVMSAEDLRVHDLFEGLRRLDRGHRSSFIVEHDRVMDDIIIMDNPPLILIIKALQDNDWLIKWTAAQILDSLASRIDISSTIDTLRKLVNDENVEVRIAASEALDSHEQTTQLSQQSSFKKAFLAALTPEERSLISKLRQQPYASNTELGRMLQKSPKTVENQLGGIYRKLSLYFDVPDITSHRKRQILLDILQKRL